MALSALAGAVVGFNAPNAAPRGAGASSGVRMSISSMEGVGPETGGKVWDPLNLAGMASDSTLAWYRHAELKHGRVAMAAFAGAAYTGAGLPLFKGPISLDGTTFESLGSEPFAAWDALTPLGKAQIILTLGAFEWVSESAKPHYMQGGTPGKVTLFGAKLFDPFGYMDKLSADEIAEKRVSELKNGRLAMFGMMSIISEHYIPGAVPFLNVFGPK